MEAGYSDQDERTATKGVGRLVGGQLCYSIRREGHALCVIHSDWEEHLRLRREQYHDRQWQFMCFERIEETEG